MSLENPLFCLGEPGLDRVAADMGWLVLSETRYWRFYAAEIKRKDSLNRTP